MAKLDTAKSIHLQIWKIFAILIPSGNAYFLAFAKNLYDVPWKSIVNFKINILKSIGRAEQKMLIDCKVSPTILQSLDLGKVFSKKEVASKERSPSSESFKNWEYLSS